MVRTSPPTACGELCVRRPTVISGYFENEAANAELFDADRWLKTGDIAYFEEGSRKLYIVDRKKEMIKVRGFQVAPPELEAVLLSHRQIVDAAVVRFRATRVSCRVRTWCDGWARKASN